jgi:hypothetical protein
LLCFAFCQRSVNRRVYTLDCIPPYSFCIGFHKNNDRRQAESSCCGQVCGQWRQVCRLQTDFCGHTADTAESNCGHHADTLRTQFFVAGRYLVSKRCRTYVCVIFLSHAWLRTFTRMFGTYLRKFFYDAWFKSSFT